MADCFFCKKNIQEIDFKNTALLKRYISGLGKIRPRKKTGRCAKHQRRLSKAIKRARHLGLLSATSK
ncbi:MAG: 30S ribosomal protein S18 [Candidatus Nealsonbacteria bacterium]|nr:MAG: 30S ribosomal protein S18 [Candidatus Nealsonbacteria bacterium]